MTFAPRGMLIRIAIAGRHERMYEAHNRGIPKIGPDEGLGVEADH